MQNSIRSEPHFIRWMNLDPLPASTGIQARLCWETLLVEIEAYAVCKIKLKLMNMKPLFRIIDVFPDLLLPISIAMDRKRQANYGNIPDELVAYDKYQKAYKYHFLDTYAVLWCRS